MPIPANLLSQLAKRMMSLVRLMLPMLTSSADCRYRWTSALLHLLQQPLSESDAEVVAAAVRSVSSMSPFIWHVQEDPSKYSMLAVATAAALHSGNR